MLMNFKDGHPPNTKQAYLCKCRLKKGKKTWFEVLYYDHKKECYFRLHDKKFNHKQYFKVLSWVRIREK